MDSQSAPTYWYEGRCPKSGDWLKLPRTPEAEAIAHDLMRELAQGADAQEGKMYGILLAETPTGEQRVLKAFSGLLMGQRAVEGWVPPIPGREQVVLEETRTLAELEALKQELIALQTMPQRQQYETLAQLFEQRWQDLLLTHRQRKQERQQQRKTVLTTLSGDTLTITLEQLDEQSRQDGIEQRQFKRYRSQVLHPLKATLERADQQVQALKQQRKALSRQLQAQMHTVYWLTNFAGESRSLHQLMPTGTMPTGTGECCAPKLLHYAANHGLKPLAMAEFWWGSPSANGDKMPGTFYGACADRCQPLMGFLLSGLSIDQPPRISTLTAAPLPILYQDDWLIAIHKPSGLLSVPGRSGDRQDCVLHRLRHQLSEGDTLRAIHRLDQETSGVMLLARDLPTYRQVSQQFQQRQVHKTYEALLTSSDVPDQGVIDLPLWSDPHDRPLQKVDWQRGKPSLTKFEAITRTADYTRVQFLPVTGRTHQIRVHSADPQGLGVPILGDRLYGCTAGSDRLHLHARELQLQHPHSGQLLHLKVDTPF